jgi:hypothetical protein
MIAALADLSNVDRELAGSSRTPRHKSGGPSPSTGMDAPGCSNTQTQDVPFPFEPEADGTFATSLSVTSLNR